MVTIKDIAAKANVSISTVSKALSWSTDISEDLRKTIIEVSSEMGYVAKNYKKKDKGQLLAYIGNMDTENANMFGYQVLFGFQTNANINGYTIKILSEKTIDDVTFKKDVVESDIYNGIFMMGVTIDDSKMAMLANINKPCALLDNYIENDYIAQVGTDNRIGIKMAVDHLAQLGHKKIAMLCGEASSEVTIERKSAFEIAVRANGLEFENDLVFEGDFLIDYASKAVPIFLKNGATAIVCASDLIAVNVVKELQSLRIRVPEDISVVGFDDSLIARTTTPPLTTIGQDGIEIGKVAFMIVRQIMKGAKIGRVTMRPKLIVRKSCGKVGIRKFK